MERNVWKGWRMTVCLMLVSCVVALTASHGGFRNVTIDNIEVYDTFRSAIAIETVDGGGLEKRAGDTCTGKEYGQSALHPPRA